MTLFYTVWMPFLSPNRQHQSIEGFDNIKQQKYKNTDIQKITN